MTSGDKADNLSRASTDNALFGRLRTMGRKSQHDSVHIHPIINAFFCERGGGRHTTATKDHFPMQLTDSSIECAIASGQFDTDYTSRQAGSQSEHLPNARPSSL